MVQRFEPEFIPAGSISEAATRIRALTGVAPEPTRGEKRALLALRDSLELDVPTVETNAVLGAAIARELGIEWDPIAFVNKTMLTLDGVNAILHGASIAYQEGSLKRVAASAPPGLTGPDWSGFEPAVSKIEAVTRIAALTNSGPERLGPGSKEHKRVLVNLAAKLLPQIDLKGLSKTRLGEEIARALDVPWGDEFISTGETIRLNGLNVILAGAERRLGRLGSGYAEGLTPAGEGAALVDALWQKLLRNNEQVWDGQEKTIWLRDQGTRQENQMEWPGFYFEHRGKEVLMGSFRPNPYPPQAKFGNTVFDYSLNHVWDLKAHTVEQFFPTSGTVRPNEGDVLLNDAAAVRACVDAQGLGFLTLSGRAIVDDDGKFKAWHDRLKGKDAIPSLSGKSRLRKAAFVPLNIDALWFANLEALNSAVLAGALKVAPQGRQQSGAKRPDKYNMKLSIARPIALVADRSW